MGADFFDLYRKDRNSHFSKRLLFNFVNLFFCLDEVAKKVAIFDKEISEKGISQASFNFLASLKVKIEPIGFKKLKDEEGYLIFGNHPTFLDPFLVFATLGWDKIKFFAGEGVLKIGPNFSKHIFPIKNLQTVVGKRRKQHVWDDWLFKYFLVSLDNYYERDQAVIFNQKQIDRAADFLGSGGKLFIFPCGMSLSMAEKKWRKGIGFLLAKALKERGGKKIRLLPFYIQVNRPYFFQFKRLLRFKGETNLKIFFGQEIDASSFKELIFDSRKLTQNISEEYRNFIKELK